MTYPSAPIVSFETYLLDHCKTTSLTPEERKKLFSKYRKEVYMPWYRQVYKASRQRIELTFSSSQYSKLSHQAESHQLGLSAFLKEVIEAYFDNSFILRDKESVRKLDVHFAKIGSNINQIAFQANHSKSLSLQELRKLQKEIQDLRNYVKNTLSLPPKVEDFIRHQIQQDIRFLGAFKRALDNIQKEINDTY